MNKVCLYGHYKDMHWVNYYDDGNIYWCALCRYYMGQPHPFKLDNLWYIEQLAKQKGLV